MCDVPLATDDATLERDLPIPLICDSTRLFGTGVPVFRIIIRMNINIHDYQGLSGFITEDSLDQGRLSALFKNITEIVTLISSTLNKTFELYESITRCR